MKTATISARQLVHGNLVVRGGDVREVVSTLESADGKYIGVKLAGQPNLVTLNPDESIEIQVTDDEF